MRYLEDLSNAPDFNQSIGELGRDFMDKMGLSKVHQLGLVVPDVEKAAERLEAQGYGPFFMASGKPVLWMERGMACEVSGTDFAYFDTLDESGLIMELINWRIGRFSFTPPRRLLKTAGRLEKWTGRRSIAL